MNSILKIKHAHGKIWKLVLDSGNKIYDVDEGSKQELFSRVLNLRTEGFDVILYNENGTEKIRLNSLI